MPDSKYGLLTYQASPEYNLGDYIQSLAAEQYLPHIDKYVNREALSAYKDEHIKLIMNGWFMHKPENWPPSGKIHPLIISFHLNSQAKNQMLKEPGRNWFRDHAPVGCRDIYTLNAMREAGLDAHLSGCLTTTLKNKYSYRTDEIYFTDVLYKAPGWKTVTRTPREFLKSVSGGDILYIAQRGRLLKKIFTDGLLSKAVSINHFQPSRHPEKKRFTLAELVLKKYATAKLVVTSRLHCALPCLAYGTPVIFVQFGFRKEYDKCRLDGVTELFNTVYVDANENITRNFEHEGEKLGEEIKIANPEGFMKYINGLRDTCGSFIKEVPATV